MNLEYFIGLLNDNYTIALIIGLVLIMAIIGFAAETIKKRKKKAYKEKTENKKTILDIKTPKGLEELAATKTEEKHFLTPAENNLEKGLSDQTAGNEEENKIDDYGRDHKEFNNTVSKIEEPKLGTEIYAPITLSEEDIETYKMIERKNQGIDDSIEKIKPFLDKDYVLTPIKLSPILETNLKAILIKTNVRNVTKVDNTAVSLFENKKRTEFTIEEKDTSIENKKQIKSIDKFKEQKTDERQSSEKKEEYSFGEDLERPHKSIEKDDRLEVSKKEEAKEFTPSKAKQRKHKNKKKVQPEQKFQRTKKEQRKEEPKEEPKEKPKEKRVEGSEEYKKEDISEDIWKF